MRTAVVGADGQLGWDLCRALREAGHEVAELTRGEIEVTEPASVRHALAAAAAEVVVNTAAMTHVDGCERDPREAFAVNALGARNVALTARELGFVLVHMSTDYVFDGGKGAPYVEDDCPSPLNVYGASKLAGEHLVRSLVPRHIVVRTSGLYGERPSMGKGGANFPLLMLDLARKQRVVRVVTDECITPTYTADLARQLVELVEAGPDACGVVHATANGQCTWFDFAAKIFELCGLEVALEPTTSREFGREAPRPAYSVLENARLRALGIDRMPPWEDGLRRYLSAIGELATSPLEPG